MQAHPAKIQRAATRIIAQYLRESITVQVDLSGLSASAYIPDKYLEIAASAIIARLARHDPPILLDMEET